MRERRLTVAAALGGALVGAVLVGGGVGAVVAVRDLLERDPVTTTQDCAGAEVHATLTATGDALVVVVTVIEDAPATWQVRWPGRAQPDSTVTIGEDLLVGTASGYAGDFDEGTQRVVRLRPQGAADWCTLVARTD